jgi:hypothetical protein
VAGPGLGLFIGATLLAALVTPPLALWPRDLAGQVVLVGGLIDGIGAVWLVAAILTPVSLGQWLGCYLLLAALLATLAVASAAIHRAGLPAVVSAAIVTVVSLAWLGWPVWLSQHLAGASSATVGWLVMLHPGLAMNGLLLPAGIGPWSEMAVAYQLTSLGQDVAYRLPSQPWGSLGVHLLAGGVLVGLCVAGDAARRVRERRDVRLAVDVPDRHEGNGRE